MEQLGIKDYLLLREEENVFKTRNTSNLSLKG
jgi:hypothetical protein